MNLSRIKDLAKDQGKTMASVASAAGLTQAGLSFIIRENSKKVDKANRRLIDLIKQRAPDYEHEAEGSHGDTV